MKNLLRRFAVGVCGSILVLSLLGLVWSHVAAVTVRDRETVKGWLNSSGVYDRLVQVVLDSAAKDSRERPEGEGIRPDDPNLQQIAKDAFSPEFLRTNTEKVLDGVYAWLDGTTAKPEFTVDLAEAKQRLADGMSNYAVTRATSLPACTPAQMAELSGDFDVLNAPCLPKGVSPQTAGADLRNQILNNEQFLADTTLTGDDIKLGQGNGEATGLSNNPDLERMQRLYKLGSYAPLIFAVLALLSGLGVLFLSPTKRAGVRRIGVILVVNGVLLSLLYLFFNRLSSWLDGRAASLGEDSNAIREIVSALVQAVGQDISGLILWYGVGFLAAGIASLMIAKFFRRPKAPDLKQSADPESPVDDSPKQEPKLADRPAESRPGKKPPTKIQL